MYSTQRPELIGNRYELREKLGQGGMGAVYRAIDRLTGQWIALKRVALNPDANPLESEQNTLDFRLSLAREFKVLASLRHPNIISVLDYGFDDERLPYVTMELLSDAKSFTEAGQDDTLSTQVHLLTQVLQALAYLHRRGILHRDLKPANVLVLGDKIVKVLDFGLAVEHGQSIEVAGTISYMAPEVMMEEEPTPSSDLYSFGVMAYELFAGRLPFQADSPGQLIVQIVTEPPDLTPIRLNAGSVEAEADMETAVQDVIGRLLAKTSQERYRDASVVLQELCAAIGQPVPQESAAIRESFLQAATFVGREAEMQRLDQALSAILQENTPQGSSWLIGGESGVGKTRLLEEVKIRATVQGVLVLRGQAVVEGGLPYQLWRDPVRRLVLSTDLSDLDASILKDIVPDIAQLLQREVADAPKVADADYKQRLLGTIVSLFQQQQQPTLLLLEDLQWSVESLEVVRILAGTAPSLPLLIVGNYRSEERPNLPDDLPGMEVIRLERLNEEAIAALSVSMLGANGRIPEVVSLLQRETEGNVFFLVEVVRALAEDAGGLEQIGLVTLPRHVFAGGMRSIVQRRLAYLPSEGRPLLRLAATAGRELNIDLLRTMIDAGHADTIVDEIGLQDWLITCNNIGILEVLNGDWRFAHDKLREAALDSIADADRPLMHRAVAEASETLYPNQRDQYPVLFYHWHNAGEQEKELHYAQLAGEYALHTSSFRDAIRYFNRALELLPTSKNAKRKRETEADMVIQLGEALFHTTDYPAAQTQLQRGLELSRALKAANREARALNGLADIAWRQGNYAEAIHLCEESLGISRRLNDQSSMARACNRIGIVFVEQGDTAKAMENLEESLKLAQAANDLSMMASATNNLGLVAFGQGDYATAEARFQETLEAARKSGERRKIATAVMNIGVAAGEQGDYDTARRSFKEMLDMCKAIGEMRGVGLALKNLGGLAEYEADYYEAEYYYEQSLALSRAQGERFAIASTLVKLGHISRLQGSQESANRYYFEGLKIAHEIDSLPTLLETIAGLAALLPDALTALTWLGLVLDNPALFENIRSDFAPVLDALRSEVGEDAMQQALADGKALDLAVLVADLLKSAEFQIQR